MSAILVDSADGLMVCSWARGMCGASGGGVESLSTIEFPSVGWIVAGRAVVSGSAVDALARVDDGGRMDVSSIISASSLIAASTPSSHVLN